MLDSDLHEFGRCKQRESKRLAPPPAAGALDMTPIGLEQNRSNLEVAIGVIGVSVRFPQCDWLIPRKSHTDPIYFWIARLGGFLARPGDGEPGSKTLWKGFQHLIAMTEMYRIMKPHMPATPPRPSKNVGND